MIVALAVALWLASVALWVGTPLLWLWIGSVVQAATDNVGAAIGVMIFGVAVTIFIMVFVLSAITRAYQRARVARGLEDTGAFPLEVAMTCVAMVAIASTIAWFVFGGGATSQLFKP